MDQVHQQKTQAIFWVETLKIKPNPLQPRKNFDEARLRELAESIRQYGILQPLVVARQEVRTETGSIVEYELIAGERRWRAAQMVGLSQIPIIIREDPTDRVRLEIALIENIQREDLNAIERAKAFKSLKDDFSLSYQQIASKVGKSREFVSNSLRLLSLPEIIRQAISDGKISEGHSRSLLTLADMPEEQMKLFLTISGNPTSVRQAEEIARRLKLSGSEIAQSEIPDPEIKTMEEKLNRMLKARIKIEKKEEGGKISLEFFSEEELKNFLRNISVLKTTSAIPSEKIAAEPQASVFTDPDLLSLNEMANQGAANEEDIADFTV